MSALPKEIQWILEDVREALGPYKADALVRELEQRGEKILKLGFELALAKVSPDLMKTYAEMSARAPHDWETLLKNENELYRQATERAERAEARASKWKEVAKIFWYRIGLYAGLYSDEPVRTDETLYEISLALGGGSGLESKDDILKRIAELTK